MTGRSDAAHELRGALGDPAEDEERAADTALAEQGQQPLGIGLRPVLAA